MSNNDTFLQCQSCGYIYTVPQDIAYDVLYVSSCCPKCHDYLALNVGSNEDDVLLYRNDNIER